jgi:hypothetical protein
MSGGKVQPYLCEQLAHPATDLDEHQPQGVKLHPPEACRHQLPSQFVEQPVGCGM